MKAYFWERYFMQEVWVMIYLAMAKGRARLLHTHRQIIFNVFQPAMPLPYFLANYLQVIVDFDTKREWCR